MVTVNTAFITVGGIGCQTETAGCHADKVGLEECTFQQYGIGISLNTGIFTAHDTGNGDGFCFVANAQIVTGQIVFLAVESNNAFTGCCTTDDDFAALKVADIEGMKRYTMFQHHIVCDVDQVIDRADADCIQCFFHPFGRFADFDAADNAGCVQGADVRIFQCHKGSIFFCCTIAAVDVDSIGFHFGSEESCQVTGDADVRQPVRTVRSDRAVVYRVGIQEFTEGHAEFCIGRENHESVMIIAESQFPGGAHHTEGFHAAEFAFLNDERAFFIFEFGADCGEGDNVPCITVGSTADDLKHFITFIDLTDGEVIGIFMFIAGKDLCCYNAFRYGTGLADAFHFETSHGQLCGKFFIRKGKVHIFFQPASGDIHNTSPQN